jgi:hypothetical protein
MTVCNVAHHSLVVPQRNLTGEVTGSLLCIIAGIFDKPFMIGFTNATKEIACKTKAFHKRKKLG